MNSENVYFMGTKKNINEFKLENPSFNKILYLAKNPHYSAIYGDYVYAVFIRDNLNLLDVRKSSNIVPLIKDKKLPKILKLAYTVNKERSQDYSKKTIDFLDICRNFYELIDYCKKRPWGFDLRYSYHKSVSVSRENIDELIEFAVDNEIYNDTTPDDIRKILTKIIVSNTNGDGLICDEYMGRFRYSKVLYCVDKKIIDKVDPIPVIEKLNSTNEYQKLLNFLNIKKF